MTLKDFSIEGKVAIVTGAGKGIGRAVALTLAEAGADCVVVARTKDQIEDTAKEVRKHGRRSIAIAADATIPQNATAGVERTVKELGRIDILVNNTGLYITKPVLAQPEFGGKIAQMMLPGFNNDTTEAEWRVQVDTNLSAAFFWSQAAAKYMIQQQSGTIINITSTDASYKPTSFHVPYVATKWGLAGLTRALCVEWARWNITVNAIAPGYVPTPGTEYYYRDPDLVKRMRRSIPLNRFCDPREVGLAAVYLASKASSYMTGSTITLDGGWTASP